MIAGVRAAAWTMRIKPHFEDGRCGRPTSERASNDSQLLVFRLLFIK